MGRRGAGSPLAVFDLDLTLLADRTILHLGRRFGVADAIQRIWDQHRPQELAAGEAESRQIATLFAGTRADAFATACSEVPLRDGAAEAVAELHHMGFRIGIASASYRHATAAAAARLGLDFDVGVGLVERDGVLTGEVEPPRYAGPCGQFVCKAAVLRTERERTGAGWTLGVGDGANDVCLLEATDYGIAVEPCHPRLAAVADSTVEDLRLIPDIVRQQLPP